MKKGMSVLRPLWLGLIGLALAGPTIVDGDQSDPGIGKYATRDAKSKGLQFSQTTPVAAEVLGSLVGDHFSNGRLFAEWPPTIDVRNKTTRTLDGRTIERYVHGAREQWGYGTNANSEWGYPEGEETGPKQQNHNSFYVVAPKVLRKEGPLCVVLHSANRTAYDYLGFACLGRKTEAADDPPTAMTNPPDDVYALYLNSMNAEWWGWSQVRQSVNYAKHFNAPAPAELRVLDTIEWVVTHYKIDRNRIYLCGVSMGGCGALGIGMPHGDIFAAVRVTVPAGTGYAAYRMGGFASSPAVDAPQTERDAWIKQAAGVGLPDPPIVVDFSSQSDVWATTQPALVQAAQAGHLPLVLSWGTFGHATFASLIAKQPVCEVALAYPWLEVRKNEAYPVFTHASSDQRAPWLNAPADYDDSGQINAYFRWKCLQDSTSDLAFQLWIAHPAIKGSLLRMPNDAVADVTPRRAQQFRVRPRSIYSWKLTRAGKVLESGQMTPDAANLLTIPRVNLSSEPVELRINADG
jgi:poly(3-hydroxybutyrate) depolymerase